MQRPTVTNCDQFLYDNVRVNPMMSPFLTVTLMIMINLRLCCQQFQNPLKKYEKSKSYFNKIQVYFLQITCISSNWQQAGSNSRISSSRNSISSVPYKSDTDGIKRWGCCISRYGGTPPLPDMTSCYGSALLKVMVNKKTNTLAR